jgi:hypothetical protein
MDAILGVDNEAWVGATRLVRVNDFIDAGRAIKPRGFAETGKIVANGDVWITQTEVNSLILFVIGVRKIDGRGFVKG